jgi:hypothetical protein
VTDTKPARLSNLERGVVARAAPLVLPALLATLALAGVTVLPVAGIKEARTVLEQARQRAQESRAARALWEAHRDARTEERARAAIEALRAALPDDCTNVMAYAAVRKAALDAGLEIARLDVGLVSATALERTTDVISTRAVLLSGSANAPALLEFVERLRCMGFPTAVTSAALERRAVGDAYDFRLELGLLHYSDLSAFDAESGAQEGQP